MKRKIILQVGFIPGISSPSAIQKAIWNEHGTSNGVVPRPFMQYAKKYCNKLSIQCVSELEQLSKDGGDLRQALAVVSKYAIKMEDAIRGVIDKADKLFEPHRYSYKMWKVSMGYIDTKMLVLTGEMYENITSQVFLQ